jgi:hypothetical protein
MPPKTKATEAAIVPTTATETVPNIVEIIIFFLLNLYYKKPALLSSIL